MNGHMEEKEWKTGLYDCFSGWDSTVLCLQGFFTPCWMFGDNLNLLRGDGCCGPCCLCCHFPCCGSCYAAHTRRQIRQKYGIKEGPMSDGNVWTYCSCCATCQEAKELQAHLKDGRYTNKTAEQATMTTPPTAEAMDGVPAVNKPHSSKL